MIESYLPAVILAALALFVARLLFSGRKSRRPSAPVYRAPAHPSTSPSSTRRRGGAFRAVSCSGPCSAVREIREKRFLERDAPGLPLPGCLESRCHCVYIHHDDRRSGRRDRRGLSREQQALFDRHGIADRRLQRGRRATDFAMA